MFVHVLPSLERCHCCAYAFPMPVHVPWVEVSVTPRRAAPAIVGATVFTGGELGIGWVAALATAAVPSALVAVISTRSSSPSSATPTVYVERFAPVTDVHVLPS